MSKNQLHRINTIGLLGLCHVQPHIRHATLKLISVLSKLTENQNTLCRFIFTNAKIYPSLIEKRLKEVEKLGFKTCIIPENNKKGLKENYKLDIIGVKNIGEALKKLGIK